MLRRSTVYAVSLGIFTPSFIFLSRLQGHNGRDPASVPKSNHVRQNEHFKSAVPNVNCDVCKAPITDVATTSIETKIEKNIRESFSHIHLSTSISPTVPSPSSATCSQDHSGSSTSALLDVEKRLVTMRESSEDGVYIMEINNPPVNTLTLPVMRQVLECLRWAAEMCDKDITTHKNGSSLTNSKQNPCVTYLSGKKGLSEQKDTFHVPKGIVITSSLKNIFSAGLDLNELLSVHPKYKKSSNITDDMEDTKGGIDGDIIPSYGKFVEYWYVFQELWFSLQTFPLPLVAAINGDAPAAGCILAMCCDYRVMAVCEAISENSNNETSKKTDIEHQRLTNATKVRSMALTAKDDRGTTINKVELQRSPRKYRIGITATRAGFCVPPFVSETLRYVIGSRRAELILQCGMFIHTTEAYLSYPSLVDAISDTNDTVLDDALHIIRERFIRGIPFDHTRWIVKDHCRGKLISMLDSRDKRLQDVSDYINMLRRDEVHENLLRYKKSLSS